MTKKYFSFWKRISAVVISAALCLCCVSVIAAPASEISDLTQDNFDANVSFEDKNPSASALSWLKADTGMATCNIQGARTKPVLKAGIGGKANDDYSVQIVRNAPSGSNDHFFGLNNLSTILESSVADIHMEFSIYTNAKDLGGEDTGTTTRDSIALQFVPTTAANAAGRVQLVTDPAKEVTSGAWTDRKYYIAPGQWNHISVTGTPKTGTTKILINGVDQKAPELPENKYWNWNGTGTDTINLIRIYMPGVNNYSNVGVYIDDLAFYTGDKDLDYVLPSGKLTVNGGNAVVDNDLRKIWTLSSDGIEEYTTLAADAPAGTEMEWLDSRLLAVREAGNPNVKYYNTDLYWDNLVNAAADIGNITSANGTKILNEKMIKSFRYVRTKPVGVSERDGGKAANDVYVKVEQNCDDTNKDSNTWLGINSALVSEENPMHIGFSVYIPEEIVLDNTLYNENANIYRALDVGYAINASDVEAAAITCRFKIVTVKTAEAVNGDNLSEFVLCLEPGAWHRVELVTYPGKSNAMLIADGKTYQFSSIGTDITWGTRFNQIRFNGPSYNAVEDFSYCLDDFVWYTGDNMLPDMTLKTFEKGETKGNFRATVTGYAVSPGVMLIGAYDNEGALTKCNLVSLYPLSGTTEFVGTADITDADSYRCFYWDSLISMMPLAGSVEWTDNEQTE